MKEITASAPGKVILTGEHFVVHGAFSLASAISKRVKVTIREESQPSFVSRGHKKSKLDVNDGRFIPVKAILKEILEKTKYKKNFGVTISSEIPAGSGLGSSAAISVATAGAALKFLDLDTSPRKISEAAMHGERLVHGNPSGIDIETSLAGGMVLFSKNAGAKQIPLDRGLQLIVSYSGVPRNTSRLIGKVASKKKEHPHFFESLTSAASFLSLGMVEAVASGDLPRLGAFMNLSQTTLSWIGVSNKILDDMIDYAMSQHIFGAKLTGAGGGGSIIALPKPESSEVVLSSMTKKHPFSFLTRIPQKGLIWLV